MFIDMPDDTKYALNSNETLIVTNILLWFSSQKYSKFNSKPKKASHVSFKLIAINARSGSFIVI